MNIELIKQKNSLLGLGFQYNSTRPDSTPLLTVERFWYVELSCRSEVNPPKKIIFARDQRIKKMRWSPFLGIPICLALLSFFLFNFASLKFPSKPSLPKLFTAEELALYNGTDPQLPILLGILGSVFDVSKGKSHYGAGGGYNHFSGRDASRAFVSGNFTGDGLTDDLHGLSSTEVKSIVEWRDFYSRTYIFVGKLIGRYHDSEGNPTKYLKGVEVKAARGAQLLEKQKIEEAKVVSCNSRWSQEEGSEVWCDEGYPRLVQRPVEIAITGKMSKRCACFKEDELEKTGLEVYDGCDYLARTCRL